MVILCRKIQQWIKSKTDRERKKCKTERVKKKDDKRTKDINKDVRGENKRKDRKRVRERKTLSRVSASVRKPNLILPNPYLEVNLRITSKIEKQKAGCTSNMQFHKIKQNKQK